MRTFLATLVLCLLAAGPALSQAERCMRDCVRKAMSDASCATDEQCALQCGARCNLTREELETYQSTPDSLDEHAIALALQKLEPVPGSDPPRYRYLLLQAEGSGFLGMGSGVHVHVQLKDARNRYGESLADARGNSIKFASMADAFDALGTRGWEYIDAVYAPARMLSGKETEFAYVYVFRQPF